MLEPNSRRLLFDSLAPPSGYRLDWTIGTTYTLDLMAMLAAPVAFAFSDWQDQEGRPIPDPIAMLKAVRQYAGRMCLFHHAGKIHVPTAYQPLLQSLEKSLVEARAPRGGSFHPKVWFMRYVSDDESIPVRYRCLCMSRNLTFDRCWDTLLCLDGELTNRSNAIAGNHPLGRFVESLPGMAVRGLTKEWKKRFDALAYDIRRVAFEIPQPFDELAFWPIGIDENEDWPFDSFKNRTLVISPFVSDSMLDEFTADGGHVELISRPDQLELLKPSTLQAFQNVWVLDEAAEPESGDLEKDVVLQSDSAASGMSANNTDVVQDGLLQDAPLSGLHAKLYVVDEGWHSSIYTGSANATHAAFYDNVEFLTQLRAKRIVCGVDAVLGRSTEDKPNGEVGKNSVASLADLLQSFEIQPTSELVDQTVKEFERLVDDIAKSVSAAQLVATCEQTATEDTYSVSIAPSKKLRLPEHAGFELTIRPASMPNWSPSPVVFADAEWVRFGSITLLGLTSFFVFEVTCTETRSLKRSFVLNLPIEGEPENRKEALLRSLLSDRGRVMRFMLMLLGGPDVSGFGGWLGSDAGTVKSFQFASAFGSQTLLESLMRCLDHDPARLRDVHAMISDLKQSADGLQLLPEDLDSIWEPIWAVAQQQLNGGTGEGRS